MISALDILPTCVAAAGADPSSKRPLDGVNLLPFLDKTNESVPHETLFWHKLWFSAMREGPWKLIWVQDYGYALYNLENDLSERIDLSKTQPDRVDRMAKSLNSWKSELAKPQWSEDIRYFKIHTDIHRRIINGALR